MNGADGRWLAGCASRAHIGDYERRTHCVDIVVSREQTGKKKAAGWHDSQRYMEEEPEQTYQRLLRGRRPTLNWRI
jgi:hypothetical protein